MAPSKKPASAGSKKPSSAPAYGMGGNPTARSKAKGNAYGPTNAPGRSKADGMKKPTPPKRPSR